MKKLYLIGGTMGVGKTTTCQLLKKKCNRSVFLDGDWCWDMHPFQVTHETKQMVMENICFQLNNFIRCTAYDCIIFGWVMQEQSIIEEILSRLDVSECQVIAISLVCEENVLRKRLQKDVDAGLREEDVIARSVERIPMYEKLNTIKVDVTHISAEEAAERLYFM